MNRPIKRSFSLKGHKTSISIEQQFWDALKDAADATGQSLAGLVSQIDENRAPDTGLSSAVRVWILDHYRNKAAQYRNKEEGGTGA